MSFADQVYAVCKRIPRGKVATYKSIAEVLGTKAYRAVGNALKNNKHPDKIPCFRVVKSNGEIGGYCGDKSENIKIKIQKLKNDGIIVEEGKVNLLKYGFEFRN